jgi:hypothetical protein
MTREFDLNIEQVRHGALTGTHCPFPDVRPRPCRIAPGSYLQRCLSGGSELRYAERS